MSRPESDMSELLAQRRRLDARLQACDEGLKKIEEKEAAIYQENTRQILEIHGAAQSKVVREIRDEILRYEQALATVNAQLLDAQRELRTYSVGLSPNDPGIVKRKEEIAIHLSNLEGLGKIKEAYEIYLLTQAPNVLDAVSAFMSRYQTRIENERLKQLDSFVIACMEGKAFVPIVECYITNNAFDAARLYEAIYLASWFDNHKALEIIFSNCDSLLNSDFAIKIMNQGKADCDRQKKQASYNQQNKTAQQSAAVAVMSTRLSSVIRDLNEEQHSSEHEHSSDEERLVGSGSHSHDRNSPHEPSSPGSSESDPESTGSTPPKVAVMPNSPPKPLSERAQSLISRFGVDKALSLAQNKIDLQKEICDQGLTFTYFDDENKNVFHRFVISEKFEIASYILALHPEAVNSENSEGQTALHLRMAIKVFADENSVHFQIAEDAFIKIINFLLANNADPTIRDNYGNTADYYADQKKLYRCAQLLRDSMVKYTKSHAPAPLLSQPAEISHVSPATPSQSLPPTPASVPTAVLTSTTSPALFRTQAPVVTAAPSSKHSSPPAPINAQPAVTGINRGQVVSQPPVNTKANKEYEEKQGVFSKLKKMLPGSSSSKSDVSRSLSPGVQP